MDEENKELREQLKFAYAEVYKNGIKEGILKGKSKLI